MHCSHKVVDLVCSPLSMHLVFPDMPGLLNLNLLLIFFSFLSGYGIVMPPFPSYMEAPAYIMPHPHIQPVDYRRLLHPQVYAPTAPYQNPNQTRRTLSPHNIPRETVNSEVQTEPPQRGGDNYDRSPHVHSDSGHGTASVSPSSRSSSQKRHSAEVDNFEACTLASSNVRGFHVNNTNTNGTLKHGFNILHPAGTQNVQESVRAIFEEQKTHKDGVVQEKVPPCQYGHCNLWSVSSSDSIVPVCSSSQQDEVVKEGHTSISDTLLSWGSGTPQATVLKMADKIQPQNDKLLLSETQTLHEKSVYQSLTDAEGLLGSKDSVCVYKILKLPLAQSRTEDANETISYQMPSNGYQIRKKMNESVWSVESLPPFIPTKEWLMQNGMFEPEVIVEMAEEAENCGDSTQNDNVIVDAGKESGETRRFSLCNSRLKSPSSPDKEATLLNSPAVEKMLSTGLLIVQNGVDMETEDGICEQLCVPMTDLKMAKVSPSKGLLVDCGIQCNKLQEMKCLCEEIKSMGPNRRHPLRFSGNLQLNSTMNSLAVLHLAEHFKCFSLHRYEDKWQH